MLTIKPIKAGSNCYLLTDNDSSILIDAGLGGNLTKILRECEDYNMKLIVLTHGHIDHIENAAVLANEWEVPIAMNEADIRLIQNNLAGGMESKGFLGGIVRVFSEMSAKNAQIEGFVPEVLLREGDRLNDYGIDATIVELPGHTAGSIGVLCDNKLFVGDALMNMFGPGVSLLYEDREQMLTSAKRISSMGDLEIYFGHGKMVSNRKWVKEA